MNHTFLYLAVAIAFAPLSVYADTVTTKDGSILNGTITLIDKGVIHITTPYAGKLKIKQEDVASFKTESPLFVRLENGITIPGTITPTGEGKIDIKADNNLIQASATDIKTGWEPGKIDPEIERNRRKWKNDFAFNLNGRTGNVDRFNLGTEFDFKLKGPKDVLYFGFEYEQGEENGNKTEDRALGQASYEQFGKKKTGWFIHNTLETDPIKDIYFRSATSSGLSYRFINKDNQSLIARNGLGYRYTDFETDTDDNESTATFETALIHTLSLNEWFYLENEINYAPSLDDLSNYNAAHESSLKIPMGNGENFWIRIGIRHEYESETSAAEKLDTSYYTQLIYSWK